MPIRISFDGSRLPEQPTLVLATKDGTKLGALNTVTDVTITDSFNSVCELSFTLHKQFDGVECHLWDDVTNFKLLWCKEWDRWFSIEIKVTESDSVTKNIVASSLGEYELSQILLFDIEINTESDILRDDYEPSVLYSSDKNKSILNRILEKAPHYSVSHVDSTIAGIQRTFSFDGKSIVDCLSEVAEEVGCVVVYDANTKDGAPARTISVYDVEDSCLSCGYRGVIGDACPECGGANIMRGYGEDTNVFVSTDNLTDEVTFETDVDSVKNCFRLNAGDDMMTAVVRACTPTGSNYIWYISDELKGDMSPALRDALDRYDSRYEYHNSTAEYSIDSELLTRYNTLVSTYGRPSGAFSALPSKIVGFPALMNAYFDVLDFGMYMKTSMMPPVPIPDTSAASMITKLTQANLSPASITSLSASTSKSTIESAIKNISKTYIGSSLFDITVKTSSWANPTWRGKIEITSKTDTADTAETNEIQISFTSDYATYLRQSIGKRVSESDTDDLSISGTLGLSGSELADRLKQYSYDCLMEIDSCCEAVLNILIETNASNVGSDLYNSLYLPYYNKRRVIQSELSLRQAEVESIIGTMSDTGDYTGGIQQAIESIRNGVQTELNMEAFLGQQLWLELNMFRREDEYTNDNYISDGLSNAELIQMAKEFIERANRELIKSATAQHSISSTLKNLLLIPAFEPIVDKFSVGNWARVRVDDEVYKLRLVKYELSYSQPEELQVEFSDVVSIKDGISDISSILSRASSMATSYNYISTQAGNGNAAASILNNWFENGLSVSNARIVESADNQNMVWDEHGMVFRRKDPITDLYDPTQLKIVNSTIAVTDDEWRTTKTAVGRFFYVDPHTGVVTEAYGVNAETIVGSLILGENLRMVNDNSTMTFDGNGLSVTNGVNTVLIDPDGDHLFEITNGDGTGLLYVDEAGTLHIDMSGVDGSAIDISANNTIQDITKSIVQSSDALEKEIKATQSEIADSLGDAVKRITPYYALSNSFTTPPPPPTDSDTIDGNRTIAVVDIAIVDKTIVDDNIGGAGTWSVVQPAPSEGSYVWHCFLVEKVDGTLYWTEPTILTDEVVRTQVSTFGARLDVLSNAIEQKVWEDDIRTASSELSGQITELSSKYSDVKQDADGIHAEISNINKTVSENGESISSLSTTVNTTASGLSSLVSRLDENYSTTKTTQSMIQQLAESISLSVENAALGSTASIRLSVTDAGNSTYTSEQKINMENVREAFANDDSYVAISAGTVQFDAGHLIINGGNLTLNSSGDVAVTGRVIATSGYIGTETDGWTISSGKIYGGDKNTGTAVMQRPGGADGNATTVFAAGGDSHSDYSKSPFRVTRDGKLYASDAVITGDITATAFKLQSGGKTLNFSLTSGDYLNSASGTVSYGATFALRNGSMLLDKGRYLMTNVPASFAGMKYDVPVQLIGLTNSGNVTIGYAEYAYAQDTDGALSGKTMIHGDEVHFVFGEGLGDNANPNTSYHVVCDGAGTDSFATLRPNATGKCQLGTSNYRWGQIYTNTSVSTSSDRKNKNHISYLSDEAGLEDFFMSLRPASYTLKDGTGGRRHMGFYSQDVYESANNSIGDLAVYTADVMSDAGKSVYYSDDVTDDNLVWSLRYDELIAPIVAIVQRQNRRIEKLERIIKEM